MMIVILLLIIGVIAYIFYYGAARRGGLVDMTLTAGTKGPGFKYQASRVVTLSKWLYSLVLQFTQL